MYGKLELIVKIFLINLQKVALVTFFFVTLFRSFDEKNELDNYFELKPDDYL